MLKACSKTLAPDEEEAGERKQKTAAACMVQARLFAVRTEMADQEGEDSGQSNQSQQLRGGKYPPHPPGGIAPKKFQGEAEQGVGCLLYTSRDIVNGTSATTFSPNSPITREQLAVIFYRYAQDQGWDVSAWTDLGLYQDAAQVSDYATQALAWACGAGLITGTTDTTLSPRGSATRAQVAVILTRFCETVMPDGPVSHQEICLLYTSHTSLQEMAPG